MNINHLQKSARKPQSFNFNCLVRIKINPKPLNLQRLFLFSKKSALMKQLVFALCVVSNAISAQVIPFSVNDEGNIIVKSGFNDSVAANLVFDTGGGLNVISEKFFQKIKNSAIFQHYFTGFRHDGDRIDFEVYKIPSLSIGSYKMRNVLVGVTKLLDEWTLDGVVSLINFEKQPITIDYAKRILQIESAASMKTIRANSHSVSIKAHRFTNISLDIFVPICIKNEKLDLEFDTGSMPDDIVINSNFLSRLGIDTASTRNENRQTPFSGRQFRQYVAMIDSVNYCDLQTGPMRNTRVDFKQGLIYDGIIGTGYFKNLPITIDIPVQKIWVK